MTNTYRHHGKKYKMLHVDGRTTVMAKAGLVLDGQVELEYRHEGVTWSRTVPVEQIERKEVTNV